MNWRFVPLNVHVAEFADDVHEPRAVDLATHDFRRERELREDLGKLARRLGKLALFVVDESIRRGSPFHGRRGLLPERVR